LTPQVDVGGLPAMLGDLPRRADAIFIETLPFCDCG